MTSCLSLCGVPEKSVVSAEPEKGEDLDTIFFEDKKTALPPSYTHEDDIVRLKEQLKKLRRAQSHVSYGPTKRRLELKIRQLEAELKEIVVIPTPPTVLIA